MSIQSTVHMDWKCSKNKSYAKTICKTSSPAESFAMLHFSQYEKENLVILMMRVRQGDFGTGHSRFLAKEWIREQLNPNIDNYFIHGTYQVGEFIDKNTGLIPEETVKQFYKEFGHDVLHGIPDEDTEGLRFVILTKQNLIELIRERCEIISDELEDKTKFVDTDYEDLNPKRQKAFVSDLLKTFRNESGNWKNAAKYVRLDGEGKVCWTPCVVDQSYRDEISWLCEIVNNYNWDCIDVILCGY